MGLYNKQGLLNGYKKNNKEREALDYYATPPQEVTNILEIIKPDIKNTDNILEPCAGGGHMALGIIKYLGSNQIHFNKLFLTDIKERPLMEPLKENDILTGFQYDFLSDDYPFNKAEYVIMNPPFSTIEPFVIRGLEIAQKGLLVLARLQFLEGQGRYDNILKDNPPTDTYVYVDRIKCYKNGDFSQTESSAQAYAWFYWDKANQEKNCQLHWIRRK